MELNKGKVAFQSLLLIVLTIVVSLVMIYLLTDILRDREEGISYGIITGFIISSFIVSFIASQYNIIWTLIHSIFHLGILFILHYFFALLFDNTIIVLYLVFTLLAWLLAFYISSRIRK
jgi:hypothetical protein